MYKIIRKAGVALQYAAGALVCACAGASGAGAIAERTIEKPGHQEVRATQPETKPYRIEDDIVGVIGNASSNLNELEKITTAAKTGAGIGILAGLFAVYGLRRAIRKDENPIIIREGQRD